MKPRLSVKLQVGRRGSQQKKALNALYVSFDLWKLHKEVVPRDQQIHSMYLGEVSHYKDFR